MYGLCPHCRRFTGLYREECAFCGGKLQLGWTASILNAVLLVGGLSLALTAVVKVYSSTSSLLLMVIAGDVSTVLVFLVQAAFYGWQIGVSEKGNSKGEG